VSKRANLTVVEACRCLLDAKHLPLELWGEAVANAVYTLIRVNNRISSMAHHEKPKFRTCGSLGPYISFIFRNLRERSWT
jgi:hypothetical protein